MRLCRFISKRGGYPNESSAKEVEGTSGSSVKEVGGTTFVRGKGVGGTSRYNAKVVGGTSFSRRRKVGGTPFWMEEGRGPLHPAKKYPPLSPDAMSSVGDDGVWILFQPVGLASLACHAVGFLFSGELGIKDLEQFLA